MICELCGRDTHCAHHHVYFGVANRRLSEKYGLVARLCPDCHQNGFRAVHRCRDTDLMMKRKYQLIFEEKHSRQDFMRIFGRNYL
jgi:hypothetical protein